MVEYNSDDIKEVMEITGLDKAKAEKLFKSVVADIDDGTDDELCSYDIIDIIKTEQKVKESGSAKIYVQSEPQKKAKTPREKKIDTEKADIIALLHKCLVDNGYEAIISNVDKCIDFGCYTVNLVKHREKKNGQK